MANASPQAMRGGGDAGPSCNLCHRDRGQRRQDSRDKAGLLRVRVDRQVPPFRPFSVKPSPWSRLVKSTAPPCAGLPSERRLAIGPLVPSPSSNAGRTD
jgi:hypothetical protein